MCSADSFLAFLAILFPPVAVWVKRGICSADSIINIALCCLGYLPGLIHAWYIISKYPEEPLYYPLEPESPYARVYYFPPQHPPSQSTSPRPPSHTPAPQRNPGYGATQKPYSHTPDPHPGNPGPQPSVRYQNYEQQTPVEAQAGPSHGTEPAGLPSYDDAIRGDYKVQVQD